MSSHRIRFATMLASVILIIVALGFSGGLNIVTFKKNYTNSLVASYAVVGREGCRKIEYAVRYGKPLDNFFGMKELLAEVKEELSGVENIQIVLPQGKIAYDLQGKISGRKTTGDLRAKASIAEREKKAFAFIVQGGKYNVFLPMYDGNNAWIGTFNIIFDQDVINTAMRPYLLKTSAIMFILALAMLLVLGFLFSKINIVNEAGEIRKRVLISIFLLCLGLAQAVYAFTNVLMFKDAYLELSKENAELSGKIIQKNISFVLQKGVTYNGLYNLDDWLARVTRSLPDIERIYLADAAGKILYATGKAPDKSLVVISTYTYKLPLITDSTGKNAVLNLQISENYIASRIRAMGVEAITVFLISLLLLVEFVIFLLLFLRRHIAQEKSGSWHKDIPVFDKLIFLLIIISTITAVVETVPEIARSFGSFFRWLEIDLVVIFTFEYFLRIWFSAQGKGFRSGLKERLRYAFSFLAIIDILTILPFYIALIFPSKTEIARVVLIFRILMLFKLSRHFKSLNKLYRVITERREEIVSSLGIIFLLLIATSSLMYYVEHAAQPKVFSSIPKAMWWGVVTLTSVGYGDMFPITLLGRIMGGAIAILGVGLFAIPAGIISAGFIEEIQRENLHKIHKFQEGQHELEHHNIPKHCPHCGNALGMNVEHSNQEHLGQTGIGI